MRNLFKKLREFFWTTVNMYRQAGLDRRYRRQFALAIAEECSDPKSRFVKLGFKPGEDGESLVAVTGVAPEVQTNNQDFLIMDKLNEATYFQTQYLRNDAGFGNYVTLPEYYHVEDPSSDSVSCTYVAVWRFNPMVSKSLLRRLWGVPSGIAAAAIAALAALLL